MLARAELAVLRSLARIYRLAAAVVVGLGRLLQQAAVAAVPGLERLPEDLALPLVAAANLRGGRAVAPG